MNGPNMIGQIKLQIEMAAFAEKIALSEMEEARTQLRTKELAFELARFNMKVLEETAKELERQQFPQGKPEVLKNLEK